LAGYFVHSVYQTSGNSGNNRIMIFDGTILPAADYYLP
jgi:hypothetical protein